MSQKPTDQPTNTLIESLGVYLPPHSVSTREVLQACTHRIRFPLEKITGIKYRRMAGKEEFAIDLARKAVEDCLQRSRYDATDIDLLICCNISRVDGPQHVSFEPSTSMRLKAHFGMKNALVFDITNACAGMFTGIYLANTLLNTGAIRRGLVVSGEYITHLTDTAQREVKNFMDSKLACLTLGDAGAAVLLEKGPDKTSGFQEMDLQTFGRYSPYCIAKESDQGGWVMITDSVNLTDVAVKEGAGHALRTLKKANWSPKEFQHLIMHQTSKMTMNSACKEINNSLNDKICHDGNTINNLEERGNTASTSHFIALADQIRNQRINSGDKMVFSVSASGLTVGTALYVFDDLPDRFRSANGEAETPLQLPAKPALPTNGLRMHSIGRLPEGSPRPVDSMDHLQLASQSCLDQSDYVANDMGLLIYSGVYRSEYLMEPAYAALLAGKLNMNATLTDPDRQPMLAFDIFNGSIGFLNACYIAQQMIADGKCKQAMVAASETENNIDHGYEQRLGVKETASAMILDQHPEPGKGFSQFLFEYAPAEVQTYVTKASTEMIRPRMIIEKALDLEEKYIQVIVPLVHRLLEQEGITLEDIDPIFPPQVSPSFIERLSEELGIPLEKFVVVGGDGPDLFSSSLPLALDHAQQTGRIRSGETGLIIAVGSGIQVGGCLYHF